MNEPLLEQPPSVPKLKLKHITEQLVLGDSMKIIGLHERGYRAQINGKIEVCNYFK